MQSVDVPSVGNDVAAQASGIPIVVAAISGSPVAAPAWSLQPVMSSTLVRNSTMPPTMARSFWQALIVALRVSLAFSFES